jgi:predicted nucleic acid-binding protein
MKVIVDTSVWSLALRRHAEITDPYVALLKQLVKDGRVVLLGTIRQEVLSGIRYPKQYERLKNDLRAFSNLKLEIEDYEVAAHFFNLCRQKGIQGSNTDYLICAAASQRNYEILTTDNDFNYFAKHLSIQLLNPNG